MRIIIWRYGYVTGVHTSLVNSTRYVVTYAYAHAPSREDTRIVKGEKGEYRGERGGEGECRGERETGKGKMEECRL